METTVVATEERTDSHRMHCMEVFGGSQVTSRGVQFGGLDVWLFSKPFGEARNGGDVYYASSCINGRIARFLVADVVGHGIAVADTAAGLKVLMRRFVNWLDQGQFVRLLNHQFAEAAPAGVFATAIVATFFAPNGRLSLCNAGHPPPLLYRAASRQWALVGTDKTLSPRNIPLGILDLAEYEHFDLELDSGDCLLIYTDALMEACGPDAEILGEEGLLKIVGALDAAVPKQLVESLLNEIRGRYPAALSCDDVTVMVLQANGKKLRFSALEKFGVAAGFLDSWFGALRRGENRPPFPFPDFNVANVGGAFIPALSKLWRR